MPIQNTKPLVAAALLCQSVLKDQDGTASVIKVVDTFSLEEPENLPENIGLSVPLQMFVAMKSGDFKGAGELSLVLHRPTGKVEEPRKWPVVFEGGPHGVQIGLRINIVGPDLGHYWFDVLWEGERMTAIPFRITRPEQPTSPLMPSTTA